MTAYLLLFSISGFCSILYELIWLRLAMAQFGVTTPLISMVLSIFMAGVGAGSWLAGAFVRRHGSRIKFPPLRLYAIAELLICVSAMTVPLELHWGGQLMNTLAGHAGLSSSTSYLISGAVLSLTLIPWCACMGATIPLAMFAIRAEERDTAARSFSFLYVANVFGAILGAAVPPFLIELYGFHDVLRIGALLNAVIAATAFSFTLRSRLTEPAKFTPPDIPSGAGKQEQNVLALLFATGLTSMGMEVVWIRMFTPYLGTAVYAFAVILAVYLFATLIGSRLYRSWSRTDRRESALRWLSLMALSLLPLVLSDPRLEMSAILRVVLGVAPVSGTIGFLTPMLVDRWSGGDPDRAGRAYAVNVVGCILGPLVSGFLLLPLVSEDISMMLLALPWLAMAIPTRTSAFRPAPIPAAWGIVAASAAIFFFTEDYETRVDPWQVLRDSTATVIATGEGMDRRLFVNGIGMTALIPVTKMMAHFTLASIPNTPTRVLIICFGMGTTFRSALSWNTSTTAVELVPSVPKLFSFYHADGEKVMASPLAHVVIDDGRRYLTRSGETWDVVILDPPPPVHAAASSLLYSEDFYKLVKQRLDARGILQQWLPEGDAEVQSAVARALKNSFPFVRVFHAFGDVGWHYLASMQPIPVRTAAELLARMPALAVTDMMEWGPGKDPLDQLHRMVVREMAIDRLIALAPQTPALQDDRPINEYYLLRRYGGRFFHLWRSVGRN